MKRRILLLPLAALIIASLCVWRITHPRVGSDAIMSPSLRPAPGFELYNQNSVNVRLERYLGRHAIALIFFAGESGAESVPEISRFVGLEQELIAEDAIVIGISRNLPQDHEKSFRSMLPDGRISSRQIQLVSDLTGSVHRTWGLPEELRGNERRVFLIDRAGRVGYTAGRPAEERDFEVLLNNLLGRSKTADR